MPRAVQHHLGHRRLPRLALIARLVIDGLGQAFEIVVRHAWRRLQIQGGRRIAGAAHGRRGAGIDGGRSKGRGGFGAGRRRGDSHRTAVLHASLRRSPRRVGQANALSLPDHGLQASVQARATITVAVGRCFNDLWSVGGDRPDRADLRLGQWDTIGQARPNGAPHPPSNHHRDDAAHHPPQSFAFSISGGAPSAKLRAPFRPIGRATAKPYQGAVMQTARRAGFSLIEALVVLAIGGMALAVIFSIGIKAGDTGFSLGRRAMSVADADVAISDLRAIIRSLSVRPTATIIEGVDQPILAGPERLEADAVMERATGCAPQGWAGRLTLTIETQGDEKVLMCEAGPRKTPIMNLPRGATAAFSYSTDSTTWTPAYESPSAPSNTAESFRSFSLWVRLNAEPTLDVVDLAASGRPERWTRPDAPF
ncbi:hypothetical protein CQ039_16285 [Brevundimonas sp. MYb52]|nr:hypothetical protein CQ026_16130 [Brevundimonas sp. MYb31]PRB10222.1 hypothetical protein CQ039_16285 [Brevundimonas sp. MYb52]PRB44176.1 hypothetical protein CQ028_13870 [Brevundimonas sp. MYb33]